VLNYCCYVDLRGRKLKSKVTFVSVSLLLICEHHMDRYIPFSWFAHEKEMVERSGWLEYKKLCEHFICCMNRMTITFVVWMAWYITCHGKVFLHFYCNDHDVSECKMQPIDAKAVNMLHHVCEGLFIGKIICNVQY